ncbi:MAG: DUF4397 domain-containing protein [Marmoricola sp.]|nr:DUF4397 domain-containing protein [Marmoricola sp.]
MLIALALAVGLVAAGFTADAARSATGAPSRSLPDVALHRSASRAVAPTAAAKSSVDLVQALPGATVSVQVDGRTVGSQLSLGKVVGPVALAVGAHEVRFEPTGGAPATAATITVESGSVHDVVLHAPADPSGDPVVSVFRTPDAPIAAGKARVLLAHAAEVGAGDIWVDGQKAFTSITNGQYAQADVPAGPHSVAIRPAGQTGKPILGPLSVDLAAGTVTLAYAVGNPAQGGMSVVAHAVRLEPDGSVTPLRIHTGSAGLAAKLRVRGFGTLPRRAHR